MDYMYSGLILIVDLESGEVEEAVKYLLRAGDQTRLLYAHEEAVDYYQRALVLIKKSKDYHQAAQILMKLGLTFHNAFKFSESREAYIQAFDLWQKAANFQPATSLSISSHTLRLATSAILELDPALTRSMYSTELLKQLFMGLVQVTSDLDIIPAAARSWEVKEKGRSYLFRLRENLCWSDGMPLTSADFAYAWQRVLDPKTESPNADLLFPIKGARAYNSGIIPKAKCLGIETPDPYKLLVKLKEPCGFFLQLMASSVALPVPKHVVEVYGTEWSNDKHIITNGPYKLCSWMKNQSICFVRNPEFKDRYNGNLNQVELLLFTSLYQKRSQLLELYESDELHILEIKWFPPNEYLRVKQKLGKDIIKIPMLETGYYDFNCRRPPFNDKLVRQAFVLALDRETIVKEQSQGRFSAASGGFIPPGMPGHSPRIALPFDPKLAYQFLSEAGYSDDLEFPEIEAIFLPGTEPYVKHTKLQLRENLGIAIEVKIADQKVLDERLQFIIKPHLSGEGWVSDYPDPDNFMRVGFPWDFTGWHNKSYERLLEKASVSTDQDLRMNLYRRADKILIQEAPIIPLYYGCDEYLIKPWIKGIHISPESFHWRDITVEPH